MDPLTEKIRRAVDAAYPLHNEPWHLTRFYVLGPNGEGVQMPGLLDDVRARTPLPLHTVGEELFLHGVPLTVDLVRPLAYAYVEGTMWITRDVIVSFGHGQ